MAGPGGPTTGAIGVAPDPADERDAWAILAAVDGLGPIGFAALLARYASARAILDEAARPGAVARLADTPGPLSDGRRHRERPVEARVASRIVDAVQDGPRLLARLRALGIVVVTLDEPAFPARLASVPLPPSVLFVQGSLAALGRERAVAVVGTRRPSGHGRAVAGRIARALVAAQATVVSGLAFGIDGAAHEATVRAGGTTVAVIGGGHARVGPRAHDRLAEAIRASGGAVVSEYAPDVDPSSGTFPRRNRIISGLSSASVIVEAPARSGALITASWALEQGRDVFVVPGPLDAPAAEGCLALLREFGGLVRVVAGVPHLIADLGFAPVDGRPGGPVAPSGALARAALEGLRPTEQTVASALLDGSRTVDAVVATTGLPVATVLATLTLLERRGAVVGRHGRYQPDGELLGAVALPTPR
ncbi:MAG: DNA-processing protein DprA [Chloroflexota bacterium]